MTVTLAGEELWQILEAHTRQAQPSLLTNWADAIFQYPEWLGSGYKRNIELPSGITLTLHNYRLTEDLLKDCSLCEPGCFEFVFNLTAHYHRSDGCPITAGQHYLSGQHHSYSVWREPANQQILAVDIHIEPQLFESLLQGKAETISPALEQLIQGEDMSFLPPQVTTVTMQLALEQILNCPYQGVIQQVYLEGKVLELFALYLDGLQDDPEDKKLLRLRREDRDRIQQAKDILVQQMDNPPTLMALAQQVGLNDRKLKEGFRQVFNTTVFGYLHQCRMEKAQQLLQQDWTIAGVAAAVGYASPTAFNAAFRRKFGVNPKAYQIATRRGA